MHRAALLICLLHLSLAAADAPSTSSGWLHLSSYKGDLAPPNSGKEQTSATVFDIDKDGLNDFAITERTAAPSVVWYRRTAKGWDRYAIENAALRPEAGSTFGDVDGDGDLDFISGADGAGDAGNQVWWWENPYPGYDPAKPWVRHTLKKSGGRKHHDLLFADVDGDGKTELVFWNQGAMSLMLGVCPPIRDARKNGR